MNIWKAAKRVISSQQLQQQASSSIVAVAGHEIEKPNFAEPYENIPGPKPLPIFGNSWRFLPYIGKIKKTFCFI